MTTDTLSSLTGDILVTSARTARQVMQACQLGGEKLVKNFDAKWESGITRRAARLSPSLRSDLVNAEREITGMYTRSIASLSSAAQDALGQASRIVVTQVDRLATTAARFEPVVGARNVQSLRLVAMPSARVLSDLAHGVADQAAKLTDRVVGSAETKAARPTLAKRAGTRKGARRAS